MVRTSRQLDVLPYAMRDTVRAQLLREKFADGYLHVTQTKDGVFLHNSAGDVFRVEPRTTRYLK